jgi:small subunit ribosomal protein S7
MPRRPYTPRRPPIAPDPRFGSLRVAQFINKVMQRGKKSLAERIVYRAFELVEQQTRRPALEVFEQAVRNATPVLEVRPRRVGGATYQVPVEIRGERRIALAMRWIIQAARRRAGKSMIEKLAAELVDAANNTGGAIRRREEVHRMAEANRAFSHYRW